jgi:hypothetical protein
VYVVLPLSPLIFRLQDQLMGLPEAYSTTTQLTPQTMGFLSTTRLWTYLICLPIVDQL